MSLEDKLNSIEKQYNIIYDRYSNLHTYASYSRYNTYEYISETIKFTLKLQSDIELLFEEIKDMNNELTKRYFERITISLLRIGIYFRGSSDEYGAINCFDSPSLSFTDAYQRIKLCRNYIFRFCEDIRLLYKLRIYPIEEKILLKSRLSDYDFIDTINCLDEVDDNIAKNHYKDAIDRSREGLEKLISGILIKLVKKPSNYFSTDIGTLGGMGFIDKENKKLMEATYSFLSEVGAHGRGGKYEYSDTYYAVKETYMRIDILINLLEKYLKTKKEIE